MGYHTLSHKCLNFSDNVFLLIYCEGFKKSLEKNINLDRTTFLIISHKKDFY